MIFSGKKKLTWWLLGTALFVLLIFRLQLSLVRFFDADEFTHLHWAAQVAQGQKMYVDFFTFFTPGFYWFFAPLFWIWPANPSILIVGRLVSFVIFAGLLAVLAGVFGLLRKKDYALLPAVILAFLPMPYDKFLEIRPDNLAVLLALIGMLLLSIGFLGKSKHEGKIWFLSGFCYGLSLIVLVKVIPMVAVAFVLVCWWAWKDQSIKRAFLFVLGIGTPLFGLGIWVLSLGNFAVAWYSLTKLGLEANGIGKYFIMEPHLFFFPNSAFYGGPGITGGLLVNHAVWILGIGVGLVRLFTPWVTGEGDRKRVMAELLVAGSFFAQVASYVQFFPLKHSQYLIPIAVFVSFYAADGLVVFLAWCAKRAGEVVIPAVLLIVSLIIVATTLSVNSLKLAIPNTSQIEQMQQLIALIPPQAHVFDLEGRLMFWKNSYPICCLPMGQFLLLLTHPPPPIASVLEADKTQYFFQGDTGRLTFLQPSDLDYIKTHYQPVAGWGDNLWQRK